MKIRAMVFVIFSLFFSLVMLYADTFYVTFFNNGNESVTKILASPAGKGTWTTVYQQNIGASGTAKLTFTGAFGNWDFQVVTSSGQNYAKTMNPTYNQSLNLSEMKAAAAVSGNDDEEEEEEEEDEEDVEYVEYSVRFKNMTGQTAIMLLVRPNGGEEFEEIELKNIANNQSGNLKFEGPADTTDWDVALVSKDESYYYKENVALKDVLKFTEDDYTEPESADSEDGSYTDDEGGEYYEDDYSGEDY